MAKKQTFQEKVAKRVARAIATSLTDTIINGLFDAVKDEKSKTKKIKLEEH